MRNVRIAEKIAKRNVLQKAVEEALTQLDDRAGQEFYRKIYDRATHILVAIKSAGFNIVWNKSKRTAQTGGHGEGSSPQVEP